MFYHPMGMCEIFTPEGAHRWRLHAPAAYAAPDANVTVYPFLTGITVTMEMERIAALQVTFDAPYEEGIRMMYEDTGGASPFNTQNLIRVCIGYPAQNLWTPWYHGLLQQGGEGIEIAGDGVRGTISAIQSNWQDEHVAKGRYGWNVVADDLIAKIAELMGTEVVISEAARAAMQQATDRRAGEPWCTFGKSNMAALRMICLICGVIMTVHENNDDGTSKKIEFTTRSEEAQNGRLEENVVNKFIMRGGFDPLLNQYPIYTWGPEEGVAKWLGSKPQASNEGVHVATMNKLTGQIVTAEVTPGEAQNPAYGDQLGKGTAQDRTTSDGKVVDRAVDGQTVVTSYMGVPSRAAVPDAVAGEDAKAHAVANMSEGAMGQIATLTTVGLPTQGMWKKVLVFGCSPRFDGPYLVKGITHRWAAALYETELKVQRQGSFGVAEATKEAPLVTQLTKGS